MKMSDGSSNNPPIRGSGHNTDGNEQFLTSVAQLLPFTSYPIQHSPIFPQFVAITTHIIRIQLGGGAKNLLALLRLSCLRKMFTDRPRVVGLYIETQMASQNPPYLIFGINIRYISIYSDLIFKTARGLRQSEFPLLPASMYIT
jgi:hypothetical protein